MIDVERITKQYGDFTALQDVSFHVGKGEVVGFLGPNGAGKTTTMRILAGFVPPTSGSAQIAGHDVFFDSLEARRRIGYLPETVPLYNEMTVSGYLDYMSQLRGIRERTDAVESAMEFKWKDVNGRQHHGKLSKGYRQRVGLAQAIVHDPEVLILDEPTIGLDPKQILEVRELIRELGKDHTVILSTHILPEVSQICSRVIIINEGCVVAEDTPEHLTALVGGGQRLYLELDVLSDEIPRTLTQIPGIVGVRPARERGYEVECAAGVDCRVEIARRVVTRGWGLLEIRRVGVSLEEVFLKLTTE